MISIQHRAFSLLAMLVLVLLLAPPVAAQGVIFGTVQNADLSNPAASDLSWFGFLHSTDEEIRTELNAGAGYDGLNWFDDFQNYTTEAAGSPYDFVYTNPTIGQGFRLTGTIPANSFQEENITLALAVVPETPVNVSATVLSPSHIDISWDAVPGLTYHIYRRVESNNGVYRRIDDPTGSLANSGIPNSPYSDLTSDGLTQYVYLLIAEDGIGNYSAHSEPLVVDAAGSGCNCPCQADINCDSDRNAVDMNGLIDILFFNASDVQDAQCPSPRTDLDCDGVPTALDLNYIVDMLFFSGPNACDPCGP